ncbi:MAG: Holliday junction branch migration protein RuvA [Lachnospiraceae bacterium]|nr:Holliday junction branch migration protein RuvA [Lachnospiraceae bacterium]
MFAHLKGRLCGVDEGSAVIEVNGVGFNVYMPAGELMSLENGAEMMVYTYTSVREDAIQLFGFLEKEELSLFKRLISVNGVGPKAGLSLLSALDADSLSFAIASGDHAAISKAPGIGKKTAERIILELKGKIELPAAIEGTDSSSGVAVRGAAATEAVEALISLGYSQAVSARAVEMAKASEDMDTETILREALRNL